MSERKLLFFVLFIFIYCLYSVQLWYLNLTDAKKHDVSTVKHADKKEPVTLKYAVVKKPKVSPSNTCDVREILIVNPFSCEKREKRRPEKIYADSNTITVIGITAFLLILTMNAILDVIKVKEEERARRKLNPDGERRQSLAEFANKKSLRRESTKFGLQLFQIAESIVNGNGGGEPAENKKTKRQTRPYVRGESTNSYLSDKRNQTERSAPASIGDTGETKPKLVKRQSVARLFGARPVPMVRRSSFPALPLNPEVQALMLGHKQASFDSDDEDSKGRRVRIIRRY